VENNLQGRDVLIIEGSRQRHDLDYLKNTSSPRATSVRTCVLISKPNPHRIVELDFVGFEVSRDF
jgi:hypoxanthine-guanine phosphoribosyltransferase